MGQYVSFNAYDADWRIPQFVGLNQQGDSINLPPIYAK